MLAHNMLPLTDARAWRTLGKRSEVDRTTNMPFRFALRLASLASAPAIRAGALSSLRRLCPAWRGVDPPLSAPGAFVHIGLA